MTKRNLKEKFYGSSKYYSKKRTDQFKTVINFTVVKTVAILSVNYFRTYKRILIFFFDITLAHNFISDTLLTPLLRSRQFILV